jgi:hypothetical protein
LSTVLVYGKAIKVVLDFKFLGSCVRSSSKGFTVRRALAWAVARAMTAVWRSVSIPDWAKRKLFRSKVEPVLRYGAEA